jgi:hypothetical protein
MKKAWVALLAVTVISTLLFGQSEKKEFPVLKGQYLGQTPPGDVPEPFLPDLFRNVHSSPAFSPDGKQVYWRTMDQKALFFMEEVDGIWRQPRSVSFQSHLYKQDVPFFSHDGEKLFFISTKPQHWYRLWSDEALWVVEKKGDGWSNPKKAGERINRIETHWQFSVSANGNIYLNGKEGNRWFIFKSEWKDGKYAAPVKVVRPEMLAEGQPLYFFPFIAPDESYLIFSRSMNDDQGGLFVTYRKKDGSWTEETTLGDQINSPGLEICPMVSPDGKYLFYLRRESVMWVSAEIIEELRPKE